MRGNCGAVPLLEEGFSPTRAEHNDQTHPLAACSFLWSRLAGRQLVLFSFWSILCLLREVKRRVILGLGLEDLKQGDSVCIPESSQTSVGMLLSSSFSYLPNIASNILVSHRDVSTSPSTYISAHILSGWSHFQNWLQNTHKMHTAPWGLVMPNTVRGNTSLQPQECKPGPLPHVKRTWGSLRTGSLYSAAPAQRNFNYSCIFALLSVAQVALHLEKHHRGDPHLKT